MTIHYAPWNRWFKTFYCNGWSCYELQIGPLVMFLNKEQRRLRVMYDHYWRY